MKIYSGYKLFFMMILLLLFFNNSISQSLKETVEMALESSPMIAAGKSQIEESELDAKSTSRSTLPQIDIDASYRHVTDRAELEFPQNSSLADMSANLGVFDTYESGLTANYLLFSGFAQKNLIKLKKQMVDLNNSQLTNTEKNIVIEVIVKYRQTQNYKLEIDALKAASKRIDLQINRIKSLVDQGMALSLDTLSLALSRLNNEQKIIAAQANLETTGEELAALVGKDIVIDEDIVIKTDGRMSVLDTEMNSNLQMLNTRKQMMQSSQAITQAGYYPKIGLFAGIKYGKPGLNFIENDWMTYGVWGVNMNWNLFKWGAEHLKIQSQKAAVKTIDFQYQALGDQIKIKYDAAVREYKAVQKQYKVGISARNLAKRKMEIIQSRYNEGMSSVTDFNDANLELTDAEINLQRQSILLVLKVSEIDYLSGKSINQWSIEK